VSDGNSTVALVAGAAALAGVGILVAVYLSRRSGVEATVNSKREDFDPTDVAHGDYGILNGTLESIGWPYLWGGPRLFAWSGGPAGVDCSGHACLVLVKSGAWPASWGTPRHIPAHQLADLCDPVRDGDQRTGDLAYYPGHVMTVLSAPDRNGDSAVFGASGGDATTQGVSSALAGYSPAARVKVFSSQRYRGDFVTFMRPKTG
jgi:hypothetical protein